MEEIYESEVWKNLEKNELFRNKFEETLSKCMFYTDSNSINMKIVDRKLVLSYHSRVINRDNNCQLVRDTKYEFFLDKEDNLIVNEMSGIMRSDYGYDFDNAKGGILDTSYVCDVYDKDGVELSYQSYSDTYDINESQFRAYKNGFLPVIESAYNPNLVSLVNSSSASVRASIMGGSAKLIRQVRSKDNLGIVVNTSCEYDKKGMVVNPKEEFYFNTFLSKRPTLNPSRISFTRNFPFATVDENKVMHFNEIYMNSGLTPKNYVEVANDRFLKELIEERELNGRHAPKDVIEKYDLMIKKLEEKNVLKRTR